MPKLSQITPRPGIQPAKRVGRKCLIAKPIKNAVVLISIVGILTVLIIVILAALTGSLTPMIVFLFMFVVMFGIIISAYVSMTTALWCRIGPAGKMLILFGTSIIVIIGILIAIYRNLFL